MLNIVFNRTVILLVLCATFVALLVGTFYEVSQVLGLVFRMLHDKVALGELLFRISPLLVFPFSFFADHILRQNNIDVTGPFQVLYRSLSTLNSWMFGALICYRAQPADMWLAFITAVLIHVLLGTGSIYLSAVLFTKTKARCFLGFRV